MQDATWEIHSVGVCEKDKIEKASAHHRMGGGFCFRLYFAEIFTFFEKEP